MLLSNLEIFYCGGSLLTCAQALGSSCEFRGSCKREEPGQDCLIPLDNIVDHLTPITIGRRRLETKMSRGYRGYGHPPDRNYDYPSHPDPRGWGRRGTPPQDAGRFWDRDRERAAYEREREADAYDRDRRYSARDWRPPPRDPRDERPLEREPPVWADRYGAGAGGYAGRDYRHERERNYAYGDRERPSAPQQPQQLERGDVRAARDAWKKSPASPHRSGSPRSTHHSSPSSSRRPSPPSSRPSKNASPRELRPQGRDQASNSHDSPSEGAQRIPTGPRRSFGRPPPPVISQPPPMMASDRRNSTDPSSAGLLGASSRPYDRSPLHTTSNSGHEADAMSASTPREPMSARGSLGTLRPPSKSPASAAFSQSGAPISPGREAVRRGQYSSKDIVGSVNPAREAEAYSLSYERLRSSGNLYAHPALQALRKSLHELADSDVELAGARVKTLVTEEALERAKEDAEAWAIETSRMELEQRNSGVEGFWNASVSTK